MTALSNFQSPSTSIYLMRSINDEHFINYLTDALSRSKTRCVELLLTSILRVLLYLKYMCRKRSVEIDYSDSLEVKKCYALELIAIAQMAPDRIDFNASAVLNSFHELDDLIVARIERYIRKTKTKSNSQNGVASDSSNEQNMDYFQKILQTNRHFGCTSFESCLNQTALFKRHFEQIVQAVKKLETACGNNAHVNLTQFSDEITYIGDFFNRLQTYR